MMEPDDNLRNVVEELEETPVNAHHAQQLQQDTNDRRHMDLKNRDRHKNAGGNGQNGQD